MLEYLHLYSLHLISYPKDTKYTQFLRFFILMTFCGTGTPCYVPHVAFESKSHNIEHLCLLCFLFSLRDRCS